MKDGIRSMLRFSWAMSLFGAQQAAELMSALGSARWPRRAAQAFDTVAGAAAEQLGGGLKDAWRTGERLQDGLLDAVFRIFDPAVEVSRALASRTVVRGSLMTLRQTAAMLEVAMPAGSRVVWQETRNKLEAFDSFQYADQILGFRELERSNLGGHLDSAERESPYLKLWLTEGLGFAFAEAAWQDGEPRDLLRQEKLEEVPLMSLIPLHTGMGLSLARRLVSDLEASPAAALERFGALCRDNARDGFDLASYEALGLVVRQLAPGASDEIDRVLSRAEDGRLRGAFWHGLGRGLYFVASQALPGTTGRAVDKARSEAPEGVPRLNALAGLAWAVALVNFRQPAVLERFLVDHRFNDDEADAVGHGVASATLLWLEAAGEEASYAAFRDHRPEAAAGSWQRMVVEPYDRALAGWDELKRDAGPGELFRYGGSR